MGKGATFCQFKEVLLGIVVTCYMYRLQLYILIYLSISNQTFPLATCPHTPIDGMLHALCYEPPHQICF